MHNAIFGSINFNDPLLDFFKFQSLSDKGDVADRLEEEDVAADPSNLWNRRLPLSPDIGRV